MKASVVLAVRDEPIDRLRRLCALLAAQVDCTLELFVAAPPDEVAAVSTAFRVSGAVRRVEVVPNPGGGRSSGLNRAAALAREPYVCRIDARSIPPATYVRTTVDVLMGCRELGVAGGHQVPAATSTRRWPMAIARVLADPLATGGAAYRRPSASGPVDTVYLGTFRTAELRDLGGFSPDLSANEDFELCHRYRNAGWVVWLVADLDVGYESRDSIRSLWHQYLAFGEAKMTYLTLSGDRPAVRQWIGMATAPVAALGAAAAIVGRRNGLLGAAVGATVVFLGVDARRGPATPSLRALAAALTPLPAIAFSVGALAHRFRRRAGGSRSSPPT